MAHKIFETVFPHYSLVYHDAVVDDIAEYMFSIWTLTDAYVLPSSFQT